RRDRSQEVWSSDLAIIDAARDGEAPLPRVERQCGRGEDVPEHEAPPQIRVAAIARVVGQSELAARILADREHALELALDARIPGCIQHLGNRLRASKQVELAGD